ncbi:MAG: polyprenyl synthetase family protein [Myxococcota bacterium]
MALQQIQQSLLAMPELDGIPPMRDFVLRTVLRGGMPCWDYCPWACVAVGSEPERSLPAAIAIFSMLGAIHLVDDMLDEEPDGLYRTLGPGQVANMALSFQSAASRAIAEGGLEAAVEHDLTVRLARMNMQTSMAQHIDIQPCADEDEYWRVVDLKTPPLFGCALAMGGTIGGASPALADALDALGGPLGRLIQVSDDLRDALDQPASADWARPRNNLAILYGLTAPHPDRDHFESLVERARDDAEALAAAQAIIFPSGAASYCVYRMVEAYRDGITKIRAMTLHDAAALERIFNGVIEPVLSLLHRSGVEEPLRVLMNELGLTVDAPAR